MTAILTVHELTLSIKKILEQTFTSLSVRGEVSNLKEQASGHIYFTLKDKDAQISAVFFRGDISRTLKQPLKNGDEVVVHGELSLYAPRGTYQVIVRKLEFAGLGALLLKLHALKLKLSELGWFEPLRKKPLPKYPKTIGVITSPTGAVIQDILTVLERRFAGFSLILNPVKVQGEGAAQEIAKAIHDMNHYELADVLIVGRGGGSLEDLWAFNERVVAEAIFHSKIPIVTAIGHETDTSIADYVADLRAPTPSAAAELVVKEKIGELEFLDRTGKHLKLLLAKKISEGKLKLKNILRSPCFSDVYTLLGPYLQKIDRASEDLEEKTRAIVTRKKLLLKGISQTLTAQNPLTHLRQNREKLRHVEKNVQAVLRIRLHQKKERLEKLEQHLQAINPKHLLTKGYCILFRENSDCVIVSVKDVQTQERLTALLQDGPLSLERI